MERSVSSGGSGIVFIWCIRVETPYQYVVVLCMCTPKYEYRNRELRNTCVLSNSCCDYGDGTDIEALQEQIANLRGHSVMHLECGRKGWSVILCIDMEEVVCKVVYHHH
jgi:hypothetical protein